MSDSEAETLLLPTGCPLCEKAEHLRRCSGCRILQYCGQDHQRQHWPEHKSACNGVRQARKSVEASKQALINNPVFKDDDPFVNHIGNFWKIRETRPYMTEMSKFSQKIRMIRHADAVQAELDTYMEILRLCPGDNMGVRGSVPGALLRLNRDQDCYDFIKWYETLDWNSDYVTNFLNIKNADVFEPVDFVRKNFGLTQRVCLILLKIKLLIEILKLQNMDGYLDQAKADYQANGDKEAPPPELLNAYLKEHRNKAITSQALRARDDLVNGQELSNQIDTLKKQIDELYDIIDEQNKHMWPAMSNPEEALNRGPAGAFMLGSDEEMRITLNETILAWLETPGAIQFINFKIHGRLDELL
ncbi:hypothetical protein N7468_001337 [Penicillium chermesinum]|uniref:MYND-type domain-containing protein n=1 Tax=Penicillium chermesinum TaxID=63820 RepID=A0A9W9TYI7_9EURO|nr:uncharacterized protein N7468_001337 [Penicillium chermesinum]KAJ5246354.1 hypothetical protein N7468_001337 [Penicillium chermesinum]